MKYDHNPNVVGIAPMLMLKWPIKGAKINLSKRPSHEENLRKAQSAQEWSNMHGIIVSYPGRVFGDDLIILGMLKGVCAIFSQWLFLNPNIGIFRPPLPQIGNWKRLKWS